MGKHPLQEFAGDRSNILGFLESPLLVKGNSIIECVVPCSDFSSQTHENQLKRLNKKMKVLEKKHKNTQTTTQKTLKTCGPRWVSALLDPARLKKARVPTLSTSPSRSLCFASLPPRPHVPRVFGLQSSFAKRVAGSWYFLVWFWGKKSGDPQKKTAMW